MIIYRLNQQYRIHYIHSALLSIWTLSVHARSVWIWFDWETIRFFVQPRPGRFRLWEPWLGNWVDLSDYGVTVASITFRPLMSWLFQAEIFCFGKAFWFYHLHNLLIHLFCVLALYVFVQRIGFSPTMGCLTALLFTSHPLVTQPLWILTDIAEQYVLLGGLQALIWYHRKNWLSAAGLALALLSKESAVTIPIWILLFDLFFILGKFPGWSDIKGLIRRQWYVWSILAIYLIYRTAVFGGIGGYHSIDAFGFTHMFDVFNQNIAWLLTIALGNKITAFISILFAMSLFIPRINHIARFSVLWMLVYLVPVNNLCNKWYLYTPVAVFAIYLIALISPILRRPRTYQPVIIGCLIIVTSWSLMSVAELNHQRRNADVSIHLLKQSRQFINDENMPHKIIFYWRHALQYHELRGHWIDYASYELKSYKTPLEATVWDLNATRYLPDGTPVWNRTIESSFQLEFDLYQNLDVELRILGRAPASRAETLELGYSPPDVFILHPVFWVIQNVFPDPV